MAYVLFQIAALLGAIGQAFYKVAADLKLAGEKRRGLMWQSAGVLVYIGTLVLFTIAFRSGGRLGVLYATYSATFVWSMIIGRLFFKEGITAQKVAGVLLIAGGVALVTAF